MLLQKKKKKRYINACKSLCLYKYFLKKQNILLIQNQPESTDQLSQGQFFSHPKFSGEVWKDEISNRVRMLKQLKTWGFL